MVGNLNEVVTTQGIDFSCVYVKGYFVAYGIQRDMLDLRTYLSTNQLPLDSDKVLAVRNSLMKVHLLVE